MARIIEFGEVGAPEYPRTLSSAVILHGAGQLMDGSSVEGMTLTELINKLFVGDDTFKFLQISDTHRKPDGMIKCEQLMEADNAIRFSVITGDIQPSDSMLTLLHQSSNNWFTLLGNHDAQDYSGNNINAAEVIITPICGTKVNMGDASGAGYWYKDLTSARGNTIRFIAFDEYEFPKVGAEWHGYGVAYSQDQIDWFINLLKHTPSNYNLILFHHQATASLRTAGYRNLFTSEKAPGSYEYQGGADAELIPKIVRAYLTRGTISGTFVGSQSSQIVLNVDFSTITPCRFIAHMGGHTHWDVCEPLPNYPEQLKIAIDRDGAVKYQYSDLLREENTESAYCINKYTVNLVTGDMLIERIGAHITDEGRNRNSITAKELMT